MSTQIRPAAAISHQPFAAVTSAEAASEVATIPPGSDQIDGKQDAFSGHTRDRPNPAVCQN
jgi:hypothetical protein